MKIPRAPKGSYHSPNAYMLVYTRNDVASIPMRDEVRGREVAAAAECILPPHLENFVGDQNLQFENWVIDVQKTNVSAPFVQSCTLYSPMSFRLSGKRQMKRVVCCFFSRSHV